MAYVFLSLIVLVGVLGASEAAGALVPRLTALATPAKLGLGSSTISLSVAAIALILGAATQTSDECSTSAGMDAATWMSALIAPSIVAAGLFGFGLLVTHHKSKPSLPLLTLPFAIAAGVVDVYAFSQSFRLCFNFM